MTISSSLVTVLYQFYFLLHRRDIETGAGFKPDPLERIKEGSYRVAINLEIIRSNDGSDDIPLWMLVLTSSSHQNITNKFLTELVGSYSHLSCIRSLSIWRKVFC